MNDKALRKEEEGTFYHEDRNQPIPPANVVAYNELRSCADLYRMYATGKLEIQPDFQREVVWKPDEQARFIDSLVKQLPIPSMCFSLDHRSQKWKVIDGLQRMHTITSFLGAADWLVANVPDIDPMLRRKTNNALKNGTEEEQKIYSSVEDLSIPVTVIRCSYDESSHMKYLFTIFNRLNSGGVRLNNQEIRNCIYSGRFNDLLKSFDRTDRPWAAVKRHIWGKMDRFRSVEILLRVLAFRNELEQYDGNLAGFLNGFMHRATRATDAELANYETSLTFVSKTAAEVLRSMRPGKKSLTFVEGVLVALLDRKESIEAIQDADRVAWLRERATRFAALPVYVVGPRYALSNAQTVKDRLRDSIQVFAQ